MLCADHLSWWQTSTNTINLLWCESNRFSPLFKCFSQRFQEPPELVSEWNSNIAVINQHRHHQATLLFGIVVDAAGFWMVVRPPSHSPMKVAFTAKLCSQGISAKPQRFVFAAVFGEPQRSLTSSAWLRAGGAPDGSATSARERVWGPWLPAYNHNLQEVMSSGSSGAAHDSNQHPHSSLHQENAIDFIHKALKLNSPNSVWKTMKNAPKCQTMRRLMISSEWTHNLSCTLLSAL